MAKRTAEEATPAHNDPSSLPGFPVLSPPRFPILALMRSFAALLPQGRQGLRACEQAVRGTRADDIRTTLID
ncbi:MAG: hypothetical protein HY320_10355 [Armatimonadetes bacterium]|nr:hypothetical protein [Armatimonadota bacterium]